MPNLNKVMLIGNLTRDPELKHTPRGAAVAEFGLAINRVWNDESGQRREEATFVDVTCWGRMAEVIAEYVRRGDPLFIEGRLQLDQWEDKATSQKRSKLRVIGESFEFLKSKDASSAGAAPTQASPRPPRAPLAAMNDQLDKFDGEDEDIPF